MKRDFIGCYNLFVACYCVLDLKCSHKKEFLAINSYFNFIRTIALSLIIVILESK